MAPGYGSNGLRGKIQISFKRYQITENAIQTVSFPVAQGITVRTITDKISMNKRQKYTFTEMEGCRFWIYTVISDFESGGMIDPCSAMSA
ncbi:hypothetical protein JDV02_001892 [Purpureocillium takamizusanense]|uniref:DUF7770 domain-containing protein n=1 Tax=Purpureocillium takamizusanense TaxID=2060973 RepID=A0A9Q8Q859_9HYPO|nr:uncharacterized protein JDV02_001892 [Purpureocillium takamizusanense]UNI15353.1 hypothetical protein JDV02_001892 [Purpureocillium takamizusanense]